MNNFKVNIEFPRNPVQGDTLEFTLTVDVDLSTYKVRCQVTDNEDNNIQVATVNASGDAGDVTVSVNTGISTIAVVIAKNLTDSFSSDCNLEIEVEDSNGKVYTIVQMDFNLSSEKITWTEPS